jgi:hypothetical protein
MSGFQITSNLVAEGALVQDLLTWFQFSLLPFMALFALHHFVENFYTFLQLSLLLISTASSTLHLQAFVATPPEHKLQKSRDVLILVTLNIWALSLLGLPDKHVWRAVFFLLPQQPFTVCGYHPAAMRELFLVCGHTQYPCSDNFRNICRFKLNCERRSRCVRTVSYIQHAVTNAVLVLLLAN